MSQADERRRWVYGPEASQTVEWVGVSRSTQPLLVVAIHGGFWRAAYGLDHLRPFCAALAAHGFAVASLEYRKLGEPGGGWPGTLEDVRAGCASLTEAGTAYGLRVREAVLVGHSAGGQLALWATSAAHGPGTPRWAGVVGLAPVSDLREAWRLGLSRGVVRDFLGGTPEEVPERYREASPVERLPLRVPTVLVHGTEDADVPYALSPAYLQRAQAAGDTARLVTLVGGSHFDVIEADSVHWPEVVQAVGSFGPL